MMDKELFGVIIILGALGALCIVTKNNELAAACIGAIAGYISQGARYGQGEV